MKRFSLPKNLSRTDRALVFLALLLVISVYAQIEMQSVFHPEYDLYATKLDEKPQKYFVLDNPDSYVLEAMLNPRRYVSINSPEDTQIDDMESTYGTNNVEFNNNYYEVDLIVGDMFPPAGLPLIIMASLVFSATSILVICLSKIAQHLKKRARLGTKSKVWVWDRISIHTHRELVRTDKTWDLFETSYVCSYFICCFFPFFSVYFK